MQYLRRMVLVFTCVMLMGGITACGNGDNAAPFAEAALHARGQAYAPAISSPTIHTEAYDDVPAIDAVVTWDEH